MKTAKFAFNANLSSPVRPSTSAVVDESKAGACSSTLLVSFAVSGYESSVDAVKSVIETSLRDLLTSTDYVAYNLKYIAENSSSMDCVLSGNRLDCSGASAANHKSPIGQ